jgi:hypothetical protein
MVGCLGTPVRPWSLVRRSFPGFVDDATYWDTHLHLPSDFDGAVGDVRAISGWDDPAATMTVTVTSDERDRAD